MAEQELTRAKRVKRFLLSSVIVTVAMFGFGYALVPIYSVFCKATGINGKTDGKVSSLSEEVDSNRTLKVEFLATTNKDLAWEFKPLVRTIELHPGENKRLAFYAKNNTGKRMRVQAIPSVTPGQAANYLKKTECFCFTQQTLDAGEEVVMPLVFHVDPDLPKKFSTVTLAYTLFDATNFKPRTVQGKIVS